MADTAPRVMLSFAQHLGIELVVNVHHEDARLFGAAAGAAFYFARRGQGQAVLGTIVVGMAVYLPLHLGLGW